MKNRVVLLLVRLILVAIILTWLAAMYAVFYTVPSTATATARATPSVELAPPAALPPPPPPPLSSPPRRDDVEPAQRRPSSMAAPGTEEKKMPASVLHLPRRRLGVVTTTTAATTTDDAGECLEVGEDDLDVTLVTQTSLNRAWAVEAICRNWAGPMVVALYVGGEKKDDEILNHYRYDSEKGEGQFFCARAVVLSGGEDPNDFPVNALRNAGIAIVETSHYFYIDIDFWPSPDLYERVTSPMFAETLRGAKNALVVAALKKNGNFCDTIEKCRSEFEFSLPTTLEGLKGCMEEDRCGMFDPSNPLGHSTTDFPRWFEQAGDVLRRIDCFKSDRYEPFLILRRCPSTPPYDERFTGYGKNKIQHVNHVRFVGFDFFIVPQGFILHFPHPTSPAKEKWLVNQRGVHEKMDAQYRKWFNWLKTEVGYGQMTTKTCHIRAQQ